MTSSITAPSIAPKRDTRDQYTKNTEVMEYLGRYPRGRTAEEAAADLNSTKTTMSARLGKLAMYGLIERQEDVSQQRGITNKALYRYRAKAPNTAPAKIRELT